MIAVRCTTLLLAALFVLAALGAVVSDLQPSALRVAVTAVFGLLAPLWWPGAAATTVRTALHIVAWSAAVACLAAATLVIGCPSPSLARIGASCAMLLLILGVANTSAAALEVWLRGMAVSADGAREMAGRAVFVALALLGSLPLWLGPVAELIAGRHAGAIDTLISASPLTHLAVASGNDLLRNQWFYQHVNLAALQFAYPGPGELAWFYVSACSLLALIALALRGRRRPGVDASRIHPTTEKAR